MNTDFRTGSNYLKIAIRNIKLFTQFLVFDSFVSQKSFLKSDLTLIVGEKTFYLRPIPSLPSRNLLLR